jgi:2-polyprenyl-3-methyl-5-hydroxy-6-metoxy-1,4-benzoquinol methylase
VLINVNDVLHSEQPCKICHGHSLQVVATKGRHFQDLTTTMCTGCGLVHSYPIPTEEELSAYYKKNYRSDYKSAYTPKRKHILRYSRYAMMRLERIRQFTSNEKEISLLDIGSGSGEFLYAAKLAGYDVCGVEPHEGYSEYTRSTFGVNVITSTFGQANIATESYDAITLHHVLEHFQYPLTALIHISQWLKFGGLLFIDVPDIQTTQHSPMNRFHYAHIYNFNHATLKAFLTKAGFELVHHPENASGTKLVAKKIAQPNSSLTILMPENAALLSALFEKGSQAEHYKSKKTIRRFLGKCLRYPKEIIQGAILWNPKRIVKREYLRTYGTSASN